MANLRVVEKQITETIETTLPVFTGFYGTIYGSIIESIEENLGEGLTEDEWEKELERLDYDEIRKNIAIFACEYIEQEMSEFVEKVEFVSIDSPSFYNFSNDKIVCNITYYPDKIRDFIYENSEEFCEFLEDNFTSYDGFWSFYSNKFSDWEEASSGFNELNNDDVHFQSLLNFIHKGITNDGDDLGMYYHISEQLYY